MEHDSTMEAGLIPITLPRLTERMRKFPMASRSLHALLLAFAVVLGLLATAAPAAADFRVCNQTPSRVGIAVGYKDRDGWTTEGWWNLPTKACETLLRGALVARYYYVYGVDYDRGGQWAGQAYMCTRDKEFTVRGTEDCLARGYDRTGFFEVDTGQQQSWTVTLTETGETSRSTPAMPLLPIPPAGQPQPPQRAPSQ
jgi:uncharacterized membrane protein